MYCKNELIERYCLNCEVGLYNCKYALSECPVIQKQEQKQEKERGEE